MLGGLLLLAGLTACPMSPKQACERSLVEGCQQLKRCDRSSFDRIFSSVPDCVDSAQRLFSCENVEKSDVCGGDGSAYNAWNAGACVRRTGAQDCDDSSTPPVCDEVCR